MNKSFGKIHINRLKSRKSPIHTSPYNQYGPSNFENSYGRKKDFYKKTLRQLAFCIVIVLLVILIKTINTPITNKTEEWIDTSLKQEFDLKNSMGKVIKYAREIPELPKRIVSVFQPINEINDSSMNFVPPVNGKIVSYFGESIDPILNQKTFQRGIDILITESQTIKSIADGEVVEIGQGGSLGSYIKIKHSDELFSIYSNCSIITVEQSQKVSKGQSIAEYNISADKSNPYFHFELWVDGNVVDPLKHIQFDKRIL